MTKAEISRALEDLTREPGFLYTLTLILRRDFFYAPEESADVNWRERVSFQEASFLVGMMVKHEIDPSVLPTEDTCNQQIASIYKLFHELHQAHNQPFIERLTKKIQAQESPDVETVSPHDAGEAFQDFFAHGEMMAEPIFYGGSGAYDFQYWEFAPKKYHEDEEWVTKNKGLSVADMAAITKAIKEALSKKVRPTKRPTTFEDHCRASFSVFTFCQKDLGHLEAEVFHRFTETFSVRPGNVNQNFDSVGAYNVVDSHPIIVLDTDLYFLPVAFNLAQSVYESPFYWMNADSQYKSTAFKNRGQATENIAFEMLKAVFGEKNVYKNVEIRKNKREALTDIDVLAIGGNKAVIIQAKSKKLTELAKRGDTDQLKKDFRAAVQTAYEQGLTCRAALIEKTNSLFSDNGQELHLSEQIDDAYIICLTTDHYPAITYQLGVYLEKQEGNPNPLAMSVFDLDIVTFYLKDPFEFLYYLRQRINLSSYFKASSEIALLAYHLRQKLFRDSKADLEMVADEFAQLIDANYPAMRGQQPKTKAIEKLHTKWRNEKFDALVKCVKDANLPGFTDAIFFLYDLAGDGADNLVRMMEKMKRRSLQDGKNHDFSIAFEAGKSGITFVSRPSRLGVQKDRLLLHSKARKYKTKADLWIGFGSVSGSQHIVDEVVFSKEPWKEDQELEQLANTLLTSGMPVGIKGKKLGRNDPCHCGSGKKYKKCHGKPY